MGPFFVYCRMMSYIFREGDKLFDSSLADYDEEFSTRHISELVHDQLQVIAYPPLSSNQSSLDNDDLNADFFQHSKHQKKNRYICTIQLCGTIAEKTQ